MAAKEITGKLRDLTKCTICSEPFTDPRVLPCSHTFCLGCLESTALHQIAEHGNHFPCPLCGTEFKIPSDGVAILQNFFIVETSNDVLGPSLLCDFCLENGEEKTGHLSQATTYCVECKYHFCDRCTEKHKREIFSRNHEMISSERLENKKIKSKCDVCMTSYEDAAEAPSALMYCVECKENLCDNCCNIHQRQRDSRNHRIVLAGTQPLNKTPGKSKAMCDLCMADKSDITIAEVVYATMHCVECEENLCENCCSIHKRQKVSRNHKIVLAGTQPLKETLCKPKAMCDVCMAVKSDISDVVYATIHCIECEENLCEHCCSIHKRQKVSRNHKIVLTGTQPLKEIPGNPKAKCDLCMEVKSDIAEVPPATTYCIECEENLCENCCSIHKSQKFSRDHEIVLASGERARTSQYVYDYCDQHKKETLRLYCGDCKTLICQTCSTEKHSAHYCCDAKDFVEAFRRKTQGFLLEVELFVAQALEKEDRLRKIKNDFMDTQGKKDHQIVKNKSNECLSYDLDAHTFEQLKKVETAIQDFDRHILTLKSFKKSCSQQISTESTHEIQREMYELQQRHNNIMSRDLALELSFKKLLELQKESTKKGNGINIQPIPDCKSTLRRLSIDDRVITLLQNDNYLKVCSILPKPAGRHQENDLKSFWSLTLPYIIQRLKMWNGSILSAQKIASLLSNTRDRAQPSASQPHFFKRKRESNETVHSLSSREHIRRHTFPVSRLDCIAYIVNAGDCFVAQDILRIMAKFPMTLPFIIPDLKKENEYIVTMSLIKDIVIKWESTPGQITENHLFSSPYKMVVAIRLGTNHTGKSTILNQLMAKQYMFSSKAEPGGTFGRPATLDGTVEIVWLTQETCSDITWNEVVSNYYKDSKDEVAILANLHGNAIEYEHILKYLEQFASSFVVFLMPDSTEQQWKQLHSLLKNVEIFHINVGTNEIENSESEINTNALLNDETQCRLRNKLQDALNVDRSIKDQKLRLPESLQCLHYHGDFKTEESENIVKFVKNHGCFTVKQLLEKVFENKQNEWIQNTRLMSLITIFLKIFRSSDVTDFKKSLMYLEIELSKLSALQSIGAREEVYRIRDQLSRIVILPKINAQGEEATETQQKELKDAQVKLKQALGKVSSMNLGQKHFFRAVGEIYKRNDQIKDGFINKSYINELPSRYAELLISGHEIELFNGDSCQIQLVWIKAICRRVCELQPDMKIFVISIIGLQSSGKSTLLNALFACRFAVSVGRCSRGLFMRMLYLDEDLRKTHGCDAIILIDTEGLASPEKMNDPKASQKDRQMATYAMGVSNLTIVNILNEGMVEMTEILQIAIIAMARLRVGGIKPDMIIVQHLQERNLEKIHQAKGQFCVAFNKAFELIGKNDIEIRSACSECLDELVKRIESGDLFHQFGSFRDGATVNSPPSESYHEDVVKLFQTILKRTSDMKGKLTFECWLEHLESYWACEGFATNFKNAEHITSFLYFEKKIFKVKKCLDRSFQHHKDILSQSIREIVNSQITEKKEKRTDRPIYREDVVKDMKQHLERIPYNCVKTCAMCKEFVDSKESLLLEVSGTQWEEDTKRLFPRQMTELVESTLKILEQTFNGSVVRQGCFSEFSDHIEKELKYLLQKRPQGAFSPEEQKEIVENIWQYLRAIAKSKDANTDLDAKMENAMIREYVNTGVLPNICRDFKKVITIESLNESNPVKPPKIIRLVMNNYRLDDPQLCLLKEMIDCLVKNVLKNRKADCFLEGINFDEEMVSEIKDNFFYEIKNYEEKFNFKLNDSFKMDLKIYTLQQFKKTVRPLQQLWNHENQPSKILMQKENDYRLEIETRLRSGVSCAGEG